MLLTCVTSTVFGFEFINGRSNGIGKTVTLSNPTASEALTTGIIFPKNYFAFEFGYSRLYELKELDEIIFSSGYKWNKISIIIGISQFGDPDLYTEKLFKFGIGYDLSKFTVTGFTSFKQLEFNNFYPNLNAHAFGFSFGYSLPHGMLCFTTDDINSPSFTGASRKIHPNYNLNIELNGHAVYTITGRIRWQQDEKKQVGIGQKVKVSEFASLLAGYSTEPNMFGGGLELIWNKNLFIYSTSYHPALGFTHIVSWQLSLFKD